MWITNLVEVPGDEKGAHDLQKDWVLGFALELHERLELLELVGVRLFAGTFLFIYHKLLLEPYHLIHHLIAALALERNPMAPPTANGVLHTLRPLRLRHMIVHVLLPSRRQLFVLPLELAVFVALVVFDDSDFDLSERVKLGLLADVAVSHDVSRLEAACALEHRRIFHFWLGH